ncbi:MAG: ComF family protein [Candidatus Omnitrophota bacterium]
MDFIDIIKGMLKEFFRGLTDMLFPKTCLSCKTRLITEALICPDCKNKIKINIPPFCIRCGKHLENKNLNKNVCPACRKTPLYFDRAFSPCIYEGVIQKLIHQFKYGNKRSLSPVLAGLMNEFIREYGIYLDFIDWIIPIPLSSARMREREYNQSELLSRHIAQEIQKKVSQDILIRSRNTLTQTGLKHSQRRENVKGSFKVRDCKPIKGRNLLLIDDVLTTGATASEAAYTLKNAGANVVFVLTLAN